MTKPPITPDFVTRLEEVEAGVTVTKEVTAPKPGTESSERSKRNKVKFTPEQKVRINAHLRACLLAHKRVLLAKTDKEKAKWERELARIKESLK